MAEVIPAPLWGIIATDDVAAISTMTADRGSDDELGLVGGAAGAAGSWRAARCSRRPISKRTARIAEGDPGAVAGPCRCRAGPASSARSSRLDRAAVARRRRGSRPPSLAAIRLLLEPAAAALDTALRLQRAEALSVTDDLTQLYNSRYLNQVLRREAKRASRSGRPLSLLFIDLDGFKSVNDAHGHLSGSRALVEAAAVIRGLRARDRRRRAVWRRRVRAGAARNEQRGRARRRRARPRAHRGASVPRGGRARHPADGRRSAWRRCPMRRRPPRNCSNRRTRRCTA